MILTGGKYYTTICRSCIHKMALVENAKADRNDIHIPFSPLNR
ncbi:hypothetical protein CLOSCI_02968 [[Clostridium] scindens ATCC 35704]|nr:hypothetical protein CLOSCI_02968 [[Clostridium] scindens ATCC 35704]